MTLVTSQLGTVTAIAALLSSILVATSNAISTSDVKEDGGSCELPRAAIVGYLSDVCGRASFVGVRYGDTDLACDQKMTIHDTASAPEVVFPEADEDKRYTLLLVDPDAPGSDVSDLYFYLHWIMTDIKGADLKSGKLKGEELSKYFGPHPPAGTGPHHYTLIVFETSQQRDITLSDDKRAGFSLIDFINDNKICTLVSTFEFLVEG